MTPALFPFAMTLRLTSSMEDDLQDLAYALRLSKSGTIRRILGRAIAEAKQANSNSERREGTQ